MENKTNDRSTWFQGSATFVRRSLGPRKIVQ